MSIKKTILLTGACGLAGQKFTKFLGELGYKVIFTDVDDKKGRFIEENLSQKLNVNYYHLDINNSAEIKSLLDELNSKNIKIDTLINNAYPKNEFYGSKLEDVKVENFNNNINIHLGGYFNMMQSLSSYFIEKGGGNIINMSSVYGVISPRFSIYQNTKMTMPVEYAAIKSALLHLTKYYAKYYSGNNIRFNCISMGGIYDNQDEAFVKSYKQYCSNKGLLDIDDVLGALDYLVSDNSKYLNGQNIIIDDGFSL